MGENTVTITTAEYADLIRSSVMIGAVVNALISGACYNKYSKELGHKDETINVFLMAFAPDRYEEKRAELAEVQDE